MKKIAFLLGLAIAIFVSAQVAFATQVINDSLQVNSLKVGQQGIGGVTYFNGTIINETTGNGGTDNPITFGDNVRIDGRVYRGATAGTGDTMPFIVNDNMEITGTLTVGGLAGDGVIGAANIADAAVTNTKLSDNAVTENKIADNAITAGKIANGVINESHISGTGGVGLPVAYGYCNANATVYSGTSNASCQYDSDNQRFTVPIEGVNFELGSYIGIATVHSPETMMYVWADNGVMIVEPNYDDDNIWTYGKFPSDFSFVVYAVE